MTSLIKLVGDTAQSIHDMLAPVDQDGELHTNPVLLKRIAEDIQALEDDDAPPFSLKDLPAYNDAVKHLNSGIDDRKFLLEKLIVLMSRMPPNWPIRDQIQKQAILMLYNDLPHPPSGYLSTPTYISPSSTATNATKNLTYAYRSADGSEYSVLFPSLGKAGMPYARSVPSTNRTPLSSLPDPGVVFDTLLRRDKFKRHPAGVSALFFAFADLVIHSIFNTDNANWTINKSSSYLDLSPLYGSSEADIAKVRRFDGTGRLWDDVFADSRLLLMPPASCALLILLNRNHNYIASKILNINERGNLKNPPPSTDADRRAQDDEIFSRARLVNTGFFMQIILGDYVGAILGLVRDRQTWRLDPLQYVRDRNHTVSPRGEGNVVSLEFNLLYRWHATLSEHDEAWTTNEFKRLFDGKDLSAVTIDDFKQAAHKYLVPKGTVKEWEFDGAKRGVDGRFADKDLANIIQNSTESYAAAFGARGIPECMRVVEIMGIEQARSWGSCSMNEFRSFIGLKPYNSFKEWNPDPAIHTAAAMLYGDINNLELHVGLQAEESKQPMPGQVPVLSAGLCPGYTISRAILADAVCLTRGDRFLTTEFTPFNLTSWGYQDCMFDKADGSFGGELTKLLFRTLPDYYPAGSAYAHFPFLVPSYLEQLWSDTPDAPVDKYTWTRPPPPPPVVTVSSVDHASQLLRNPSAFTSTYDARLYNVTSGAKLDRALVQKVLQSEGAHWGNIFAKKAEQLIKEKSVDHVGSPLKYIDIAKDVANLAPLRVVAEDILGLPLKTASNPSGTLREDDAFQKFSTVFRYAFNNSEPSLDWHLRETSREVCKEFTEVVKDHFRHISSLVETVKQMTGLPLHPSHQFLHKLLSTSGLDDFQGESANNLAASLFAEVVPTTTFVSSSATHVMDFYLRDDQKQAREKIGALYASGDLQGIVPFVWAALREEPPVTTVMRTAVVDCQLGPLEIKAGQRVLAVTTQTTSEVTPSSIGRFDPLGIPDHSLFSQNLFELMVAQVIGPVFQLHSLQRAPGNSGRLNRVFSDGNGMQEQRFVNAYGELLPWPSSLVAQYEVPRH